MNWPVRIIPRLDIKGKNLIKTVNLEGLRIVGDPCKHAVKYAADGADELLLMDIVASLYGRNNLSDVIKAIAKDIFIPITVGGGIRSVDDAWKILKSGADKVAVNTAAIKNPKLITEIAKAFGSQAVVLSIEAKQQNNLTWEPFYDSGRERSNLEIKEWIKEGINLGAGELLITSIDKEGSRTGFDKKLIKEVRGLVNIPLLISGGMGKFEDISDAIEISQVDGFVIADMLHFNRSNIIEIKKYLKSININVR